MIFAEKTALLLTYSEVLPTWSSGTPLVIKWLRNTTNTIRGRCVSFRPPRFNIFLLSHNSRSFTPSVKSSQQHSDE